MAQRQSHPVFVQWSLLALHRDDGHFVGVAPKKDVTVSQVSAVMLKHLQGYD